MTWRDRGHVWLGMGAMGLGYALADLTGRPPVGRWALWAALAVCGALTIAGLVFSTFGSEVER